MMHKVTTDILCNVPVVTVRFIMVCFSRESEVMKYMPKSDAAKAARDKWDRENMAYQTVKVSRRLLDDFKAACAARGDKVNTVLRQAMENYVAAGAGEHAEDQPQIEE